MKRGKKGFEVKFIVYFFWAIIPMLLLSWVICLLDNEFLGLTPLFFEGKEQATSVLENFYLVEVQVAFIVVSLSTALSASSKRVYWVESYAYRLVSPKLTNFTALSAYIIAALVDGLVWTLLERCLSDSYVLGIMISFALAILFMIILTVRMIDANFGRDRIKKSLKKELLGKTRALSDLGRRMDLDKGRSVKEIQQLVQVSLKEIDEKEFDLVTENLCLLYELDYGYSFGSIYEYLRENVQTPKVLRQINYSIMREIIVGVHVQTQGKVRYWFFETMPKDEQAELWRSVINEVFDDALLLWKSGKREAAKKMRRNLYVILSNYLIFENPLRNPWLDDEGNEIEPDEDELDEKWQPLIQLMIEFVQRRESLNQAGDDGKELKGWEESERQPEIEKLFGEDENDLVLLTEGAVETVKRWKKSGIPATVDEWTYSYLDWVKDY